MLNAYLSATLGLCSPLPHDKNQTGQDFYDYLLSVKHQQCPDSVQDTTAGLTKRKKKKKHCGQNNLSSKKFTNVFSGSSQALPILRTYQGANVNHKRRQTWSSFLSPVKLN